MKIIDLFEYRRNDTPKQAAIDVLRKYKDMDNVYVSFTEIDKLGINPQTVYDTPIGIYSYPLKTSWEYYGMDNYGIDGLPFATEGSYIWVFEANVPDIGKMKKEEFNIVINKIRSMGMKKDAIKDAIEDASKGWYKRNPCYGGRLWNVTRMFADGNVKKWTKLFVDLGYNGFVDSHVTEIIHENEPVQAVFFTIKGIKILEKIHNISPKGPGYGRWAVEQKKYYRSLSWDDFKLHVKKEPEVIQWVDLTDEQIKELFHSTSIWRCIKYIKNPSTDLLKYLVDKMPPLIKTIPKKYRTDELYYLAVGIDQDIITDDMPEKIKLFAITKWPTAIGHLESPSPALQMAALKLDIGAYHYIDKPTMEAENYYFQNCDENKELDDEDF